MPYPYCSYLILLVLPLAFSGIHAIALLNHTNMPNHPSLLGRHSTSTSFVATVQPHNITYSPLTFLGVDCYHLYPDEVNLGLCQPVFAKMMQDGNPYEEHNWWNGWQFRTGRRGPCTITMSSEAPHDRDRMVRISKAAIIVFATEVLETCQETSTGGANTFQGAWKVAVTKYPLERALLNSSLSEG